MKIRLLSLVLLACGLSTAASAAQSPPSPPPPPSVGARDVAAAQASSASASQASKDDDDDADSDGDVRVRVKVRRQGNTVFALARDADLPAGREADAVIAVGGNANSEGTVRDGVVAIGGNARATGPVGDAVVAVLGNTYVNSSARSVVSVFGNVELGPEARVSSEVVAVGGTISRDPAAEIHGSEQTVAIGRIGRLEGLRAWIKHCALLGRPLALDRDVSWAWGLSLAFLALYALLALMFRDAVNRCVATMEASPGRSLLAALLSVALTPVVVVLLAITIIGIVLLPFLGIALFLATLFGKAVMLTWLGRRVYRDERPLVPLLIGGVIALALYVVPVLGFIVYKLLGLVGFGVVMYTLLLTMRPQRSPDAARPAPDGGAGAGAASEAGVGAATGAAAAEAFAAAGPAAEAAGAAAAGTGSATTPPATPIDFTALPRAGFWPRMGALALDAVLILIVVQLVSNTGMRAVLSLLAIYAAIMWQLKGTTIGGSIVGLKLVRTDGRPIDWATAIVRALGCLLSLAIAGLGFLWIVFDGERQAWHDKIAGTAVVRVPKGIPLL